MGHDGQRSVYHAGWLRHVADNNHLPNGWLEQYRTTDLSVRCRGDGSQAIENDEVILTLLNNLLVYALVLEQSPTHEAYLLELAERIGPLRDSNFGKLWDVRRTLSSLVM